MIRPLRATVLLAGGRAQVLVTPLMVSCPRCSAGLETGCRDRRGRATVTHRRRVLAAEVEQRRMDRE